jgi:hypothetical protein
MFSKKEKSFENIILCILCIKGTTSEAIKFVDFLAERISINLVLVDLITNQPTNQPTN